MQHPNQNMNGQMLQQPQRNQMQGSHANQLVPTLSRMLGRQTRPQSGWQLTADPNLRLNNLVQLFTLISKSAGSDIEHRRKDQWLLMMQNAEAIERKNFLEAPNRDRYKESMSESCHKVNELAKQNMQNMLQHAFQNNHMQPPPFMQQTQQQQQPMVSGGLRNSGFNSNQQQFPAGFPGNLQQHFRPPQNGMTAAQNQFPQNDLQNVNINPQMLQQTQTMQAPTGQNLNTGSAGQFTEEDRRNITTMVSRYKEAAEKTGEMQQVRDYAANMPPDKRLFFQRSNTDPIDFHFRKQAEKDYQKFRNFRGLNQQANQDPNFVARTNMLGNASRSAGANPNAPFDSAQFAGQQAEALRSQAYGDLVVPASNHQAIPASNAFGAQAGIPQPNQGAGGAQQQVPQQINTGAVKGGQGPMVNQIAALDRVRAFAHVQGRMNQASQQQPPQQRTPNLQGQVDGLYSSNGSLQANSSMRTLTQPFDMPGARTPQQNQVRPGPPSGQLGGPNNTMRQTPQIGEQKGTIQQQPAGGVAGEPPGLGALPIQLQRFYRSLPEALRRRMMTIPPEKLGAALIQVHSRKNQNRNQPPNTDQQVSNQTPQSIAQAQGMPALAGPSHQSVVPPGMPSNGAPTSFQQESSRGGNMLSQADENRQLADAMPIPRTQLLHMNPGLAIPPHLRTWSELKQWLGSNNSLPIDAARKLADLQRAQLMEMRKQRAQAIASQRMDPAQQQMHPVQSGLNHLFNAQNLNAVNALNGQGSLPKIECHLSNLQARVAAVASYVCIEHDLPRMKFNTEEEVRKARAIPHMGGRSDGDINRLITQRKIQQVQKVDTELATEVIRIQSMLQQRRSQLNTRAMEQPGSVLGESGMKPNNMEGPQQLGLSGRPPNMASDMSLGANSMNGVAGSTESKAVMGQAVPPNNQSRNAPSQQQMLRNNQAASVEAQWARMTSEQRQREAARLQAMAGQPSKPTAGVPQMSPNDLPPDWSVNSQFMTEFHAFNQKALSMTPPGPALQLTPDARANYHRLCQEVDSLVQRADPVVKWMFWQSRQKKVHPRVPLSMLQIIIRLRQQNPSAGHFTLTLDDFQDKIDKLKTLITRLNHRLGSQMQQSAQQPPNQDVAQPQAIKQEKAQAPVRTASHRGSKSDIPPAAPTSEKPPFSLNAPSPHGTPHYAPSKFDPSVITIPQKRKRKNEPSIDNTPAMTTQQPSKPVVTASDLSHASSQLPTVPPTKHLPYKCIIPQCQSLGFESQESADDHVKEVHAYKGDALEWCLGRLREALNLDKHAQPIVKNEEGQETASRSNKALEKSVEATVKKEKGMVPAAQSIKLETTSGAIRTSQTPTAQSQTSSQPPATARSIGDGRPASLTSKASVMARSRPAALTVVDSWANANITTEALAFLFSNLDALGDRELDVFADAGPPRAGRKSDGSEASPVQDVHEQARNEEGQKKTTSPTSAVLEDLEAWDPFPDVEGDLDAFDGIDYEMVVPDVMKAGHEEKGPSKTMSLAEEQEYWDSLWQPESVNAAFRKRREKEEANARVQKRNDDDWPQVDFEAIDWESVEPFKHCLKESASAKKAKTSP